MRQKNFNKVKRSIEDTLFMAKPTFCAHLKDVFALVSEVHAINFAGAKPNHCYSLQVRGGGVGGGRLDLCKTL